SRTTGERIMKRLGEMQRRHDAIGDVRGRGMMTAIELVTDRGSKEPVGAEAMAAIGRTCLENGVIVLTAGTYGNVVRLLPPITIDDGLLDEGLDVLDDAIATAVG
ncbi:MAG: aminotransferase class III-fold pyridoxal phosphate-dependent enzyme, partial [Actinomycetota bacterium]